jgi:hypothetical protein
MFKAPQLPRSGTIPRLRVLILRDEKIALCWQAGGLTMPQDKNSDRNKERGASNNENQRRGSGSKEQGGSKSGSGGSKSQSTRKGG